MGKKPEVSLEKRAEINVLLSEGLSQKEIASRLEISQSAVSKIIKRIIEFGTYTPKPRPGRPRILKSHERSNRSKFTKKFTNFKIENTLGNGGFSVLDEQLGVTQEDNFFSSLCEIENSINNEKGIFNVFDSQEDSEKCSTGPYKVMKQERKETRSPLEMEENQPIWVDILQTDEPSNFVKLEGRKKIKSEFKRPSDVRSEEKNNNFSTIENRTIFIKKEHGKQQNFISEKTPGHSFRPEAGLIPINKIKKEKNYYENIHYDDNDEEDRSNAYEYNNYQNGNNENTFYNDDNYQSDNEMTYNNEKAQKKNNNNNRNSNAVFYPSFSQNRHSAPSKNTEYFRIYDKSIKRRSRKSDVHIKSTTFVKISERRRSHEKKNRSSSTSPRKIKIKRRHF